ncbi:putative proteasome-type protease [Phyllobacterium sp. P30BS-XVII]|nr:putative proteasome-type protease [Phyllobacterium sp. P30BS-XVII]
MSDTRTNAGVDNISTFKKMYTWAKPGDRVITLLSSGNLATTQTVISILNERTKIPSERAPSIFDMPSMFQTAKLVGDTIKSVIHDVDSDGQRADSFGASIILGGQIKGGEPRLFLIYPEGNFIESSPDTPFFQIGEHKYGKPIIVRSYDPAMTFEEATKLLFVSFDSTLKSNLSVGLPLDMQFYEADSLKLGFEKRIERNDPYYEAISEGWSQALKLAFQSLPTFKID